MDPDHDKSYRVDRALGPATPRVERCMVRIWGFTVGSGGYFLFAFYSKVPRDEDGSGLLFLNPAAKSRLSNSVAISHTSQFPSSQGTGGFYIRCQDP